MPFERPTLDTLINRAISDLELRLPGADARLRRSFENAVALMLAGLTHGLHGHLFYLSKQILPDTSDEDTVRRWAGVLDVPIQDPSKASGAVIFTGTNATSLPAGTQFQRNDGVVFETVTTGVIAVGTLTTDVIAVEAGEDGNTDADETLTIVSPVAGIDAAATVDGDGLTGGADAESVEAIRARVLERLRTPPSGGGPGDYERWAKEVGGVTRAWESTENGPGTVVVRFAVDGESSPIPGAPKVAEVQAYIDELAPITAAVTVVAPVAHVLDLTIDLGTSDTAAIRAAVETELEALLLRENNEPGGTIYLSQINEAISLAAGEVSHVLTVPAANFTNAAGELATLGTITWT